MIGICCGEPRKNAIRIDFYLMKGGPRDETGIYADGNR
jgi:hypothetical protein